jgi:hypothetical protein
VKHGLGNPPVRYLMLTAPFTASVGIYMFSLGGTSVDEGAG